MASATETGKAQLDAAFINPHTHKIFAIKELREASGYLLSLKAAKELVEDIIREYPESNVTLTIPRSELVSLLERLERGGSYQDTTRLLRWVDGADHRISLQAALDRVHDTETDLFADLDSEHPGFDPAR